MTNSEREAQSSHPNSIPTLHPMERGPGGESPRASTDGPSGSPSPPAERGLGGEAEDGTREIDSCPPSPLVERGLGGEVQSW